MKDYLSNRIDSLVEAIQNETSPQEQKKIISVFYKENLKTEVAENLEAFVGKLLLWFFIAINAAVILMIVAFAVLDVMYHIDDAKNRFIDGDVLGGLVAATIAEAVAAFLIFVTYIYRYQKL